VAVRKPTLVPVQLSQQELFWSERMQPKGCRNFKISKSACAWLQKKNSYVKHCKAGEAWYWAV